MPNRIAPPPVTGNKEWDDWAKSVYEWMGRASIAGLQKLNGGLAMRAFVVPSNPVIAQELMGITAGLQFAFNFIDAGQEVVDGYWIYKSSTSNDPATASKFKFIPQSADGGVYTFQDLLGNGVQAFYWVAAVNSKGSSELVTAGTGTSLPITETQTTYRPTAGTGSYTSLAAAYDDNLNQASRGLVIGKGRKTALWNGFSAISGSPTSVMLKINSSCTGDSTAISELSWQTNLSSGTVYTEQLRTQQTDSITLDPATDLTSLTITASTSCVDSSEVSSQDINEIWVEAH